MSNSLPPITNQLFETYGVDLASVSTGSLDEFAESFDAIMGDGSSMKEGDKAQTTTDTNNGVNVTLTREAPYQEWRGSRSGGGGVHEGGEASRVLRVEGLIPVTAMAGLEVDVYASIHSHWPTWGSNKKRNEDPYTRLTHGLKLPKAVSKELFGKKDKDFSGMDAKLQPYTTARDKLLLLGLGIASLKLMATKTN